MSATRLDLAWDPQNESWGVLLETGRVAPGTGLVRQITGSRRPQKCPECQSIVYSRRHRLCSVCSEPLPDEILFSHGEAERVAELLRLERVRHRKWMEER